MRSSKELIDCDKIESILRNAPSVSPPRKTVLNNPDRCLDLPQVVEPPQGGPRYKAY